MTNLDGFFLFAFFILGAIVGSFLNVCIVRLPKMQSIVAPASRCIHCATPIPWYDNIPLISFLVLRAHCRFCRKKISFRYFLVELLTALAFVLFYEHFGLQLILVPYLFLLSGFIVATFVDLEHRIIPDEISVGGLVAGLALSLLVPQMHDTSDMTLLAGRWFMVILVAFCFVLLLVGHFLQKDQETTSIEPDTAESDGMFYTMILIACGLVFLIHSLWPLLEKPGWENILPHTLSLEASLIGFLAGGSSIYAMGMVGDLIFRKESMGGGDVKMLAMVGAFLGWKLTILAFFIAPLFGALAGIVVKIRTKESVIAYGPFLALGALVSLFWGNQIIDFILRGYGFF